VLVGERGKAAEGAYLSKGQASGEGDGARYGFLRGSGN